MFTAAIFPAVRAAGQQTPHEIPREAAQAGATAQDVSPQDGFFKRVFNVRVAFPDGISHGFPHLWWIFPWFTANPYETRLSWGYLSREWDEPNSCHSWHAAAHATQFEPVRASPKFWGG